VVLTALMPNLLSFAPTSGSTATLATACWILPTMAGGVPAGATRPAQVEISPRPGRLAATASGCRSGSAASGRVLSFASARCFPCPIS